jgi:hypothetical protein
LQVVVVSDMNFAFLRIPNRIHNRTHTHTKKIDAKNISGTV